MPAEVAALFRVDAKTVTRWAKQKKLSSIQTVGGHRRYRASEVYELLNAEQRSSRHTRLETLVNDYYDGDPTSVLQDLADRYGLAVTVLDRAWFTRIAQRDLTDDEWKRINAELVTSGNTAHAACTDQLAAYTATVLSTAGATGPTSESQPAIPDVDSPLPVLPPPPDQQESGVGMTTSRSRAEAQLPKRPRRREDGPAPELEMSVEVLRERYTAGESVPSIAQRMGLTPRQVYLWMRHERINRRPPGGPAWDTFPIELPELREWYEAGESIAGLARALEVSPKAVTMRLAESGATVRSEDTGRRRVVLPVPSPVLRKRYEAGESLSDLAAEMAVATATVKRRLLEAGTTMRPVGGPTRSDQVQLPVPAEQVLRRFESGESVHSLALELGVPRNTLRGQLETAAKNHSAPASGQPSPPGEEREATASARQDQHSESSITALSETSGSTPAAPQPPPVSDASDPMRPDPVPEPPDLPQSPLELALPGADAPAPSLDDVNRLVPHSARLWDYMLGGSDHYEADRQAADTFQEVYPDLVHLMATQRGFKRRAVEYLAAQGVRQFLDIGPGLPAPNDPARTTDTHVIAESAAPDARTVYVDNDPLVTVRLQALLVGHVHTDIADTHSVLAGAARHLDLSRPVAVLLIGVMGHIDNTDDAHAIVRRLMDALAPGSYLALSDATTTRTALTWAQETYNGTGAAPYRLRTPTRIADFFTGLMPVQPGLVPPARWRPSQPPSGSINTDARCAVARTR